jgi:ABC-2 type transport system ATP-binding protein
LVVVVVAVAIETFGLTKRYGRTEAVVDLDLQVESGQVFGFLGPNGAGKTTTIRLLLALQRPSGGRAVVLGLDPQLDSCEIHRRIGYLPGELVLHPRMTGRELIRAFGRARGNPNPSNVDALVERFDAVIDRPVRELSKGNRQKIGIALAFMHEPELLVLDEPTSGLDPLMQNEFERLVREKVADGATVFLSSHDLDEVQRVADHVGLIKAGRLVMADTVDALRERAPMIVSALFDSPVDPAPFEGVDGVSVLASDGRRLELQLAHGPVAPLLRMLADHDPLDVTVGRADLEELFLDLYRGPATPGMPDVG